MTANKVTVSGLAITGITGSNSSQTTDYVLDATSKDVTATITPAPLNVTANSFYKYYPDTYTFLGTEFSSSGLQNGETIGSVYLFSDGAPANSSLGPHVIYINNATGGTFDATNYGIIYHTGILTVWHF